MNFYKFLIIIIFLIYLYNRLNKGPYISQSGKYWKVIIYNNRCAFHTSLVYSLFLLKMYFIKIILIKIK